MAQNEDLNSYAVKHPRRMYTGMLALGTVLGASLMAAKKNSEKSPIQKFLDQINR